MLKQICILGGAYAAVVGLCVGGSILATEAYEKITNNKILRQRERAHLQQCFGRDKTIVECNSFYVIEDY